MSQHFSEKGILIKEYELKNDTIKNGIYREFYDNGNLSYESHYLNNMMVGYEYYFKENGDTTKFYNHQEGIISLPYKKWLGNGLILYGIFLDSSQKKILWTWSDKKGEKIKSQIKVAEAGSFVVPE